MKRLLGVGGVKNYSKKCVRRSSLICQRQQTNTRSLFLHFHLRSCQKELPLLNIQSFVFLLVFLPLLPHLHIFTSFRFSSTGKEGKIYVQKKKREKKENNIAETHSGVIRRQSIRSERCHLGDAYVLHDFSSTTIYIHLFELTFFHRSFSFQVFFFFFLVPVTLT